MEALAIAGFLALVSERLVEAAIVPLFDRYGWDKFVLMYLAWIVGGLLVWLSGANVFVEYIPDPFTGQVLTAVVAGGGSNLLHDLFDGG